MPECNCKSTAENVPYIVHESAMARDERIIKRLWIVIILLILLLVGSNCAWLYYESQFETVETITETYEAIADNGGNAIANGDGSVIIGGES